jgi:hypothetical protein
LEDACVVTGHMSFSFIEKLVFTDSFTILRNPLDRIVSLYRYGRSNLSGWAPDDPVRHLSFEEWLECRNPLVQGQIDSYYVRVLTDDLQEPFDNRREKSLQLALERYQNFTCVGDQANLKPFLKNMSASLGIPCPFKLPKANDAAVNQRFDPDYVPKPEITPRAKRRLEELTRLDWIVYNTFRERESVEIVSPQPEAKASELQPQSSVSSGNRFQLSFQIHCDLNRQNPDSALPPTQVTSKWLAATWNILEIFNQEVAVVEDEISKTAHSTVKIELKAPDKPGQYHLALSLTGVGTDSAHSDWKITPSIFDLEVTSEPA